MVVCTQPGSGLAQSKTSDLVGSTDGTGAKGFVFDGITVVPGSTMLTTGRPDGGGTVVDVVDVVDVEVDATSVVAPS